MPGTVAAGVVRAEKRKTVHAKPTPKKKGIFFNLRKFTSRCGADKLQTLHSAKLPVESGQIPRTQRIALGMTESLVRLSVGVEDLRDDLKAELAAICGGVIS